MNEIVKIKWKKVSVFVCGEKEEEKRVIKIE